MKELVILALQSRNDLGIVLKALIRDKIIEKYGINVSNDDIKYFCYYNNIPLPKSKRRRDGEKYRGLEWGQQ